MKRNFDIFGDPVEMLVFSSETGGAFSLSRQICQPGGGPPPHIHHNDDEVFSVITGRFEVFNGETDSWNEIPKDGVLFAPRGHVHTFRNCGDGEGVIQIVASGSQFDVFLEGLSAYNIPQDLQPMIDYSAKFGIFYPTLPPPTSNGE